MDARSYLKPVIDVRLGSSSAGWAPYLAEDAFRHVSAYEPVGWFSWIYLAKR